MPELPTEPLDPSFCLALETFVSALMRWPHHFLLLRAYAPTDQHGKLLWRIDVRQVYS
ncbi:protein of unknown function [Candidatus Methylacidiphilum fumarolicum]|uniref:Uncharacterized protein n=1 Tax=Candidatus Methylacidiphilum fumarolicum TaxID=591154 RepID=A0ABM9IAR6_9BACT|nr:protein of unknown function [Candidatus Methylacidiphilum fumarolicum]